MKGKSEISLDADSSIKILPLEICKCEMIFRDLICEEGCLKASIDKSHITWRHFVCYGDIVLNLLISFSRSSYCSPLLVIE